MALIICTECGKKFSDKVACCPECGCPTEVVMKESNSVEIAVKRETNSREAAAAMLTEVSVRAKAKQAEDLFDSRNRTIQRKAPLCRMTTATGGGTVEKENERRFGRTALRFLLIFTLCFEK